MTIKKNGDNAVFLFALLFACTRVRLRAHDFKNVYVAIDYLRKMRLQRD